MKIYFDNYDRPEPAKLYLGTPSNKVLCALNGVVPESALLTPRLNNNFDFSFEVDRYILDDYGNQVESNGYAWLDVKMRVYLDTIGWFICDSPIVHNDGLREYKSVTAYSCDIEMLQHDIINLKINRATTDSYEMLVEGNVEIVDDIEIAKEPIIFYNRENPELSFLDIVLKVSGLRGWTIGHVDDTPYEYKYFENGELKKKYVSLSKEKGVFTVEAQDLYSFLTQDVAQFFNCVFLFDIKHMVINVWRPNTLGKDTGVNIGFRNIQNSNEISVNDSELFTTFMVYGGDALSIEYVNFGWRRIENIDHFLNEKYLSRELINKYKLWLEDVEYYRPQYIELSRLYNEQLYVVSELKDRVPLDDCSTDWSKFEDEKLLEAKNNYEAQLKGYESYYVDENNNFDKEALDNSVDADTYYQIKDVILPSIEIEMRNRKLDDEDDYEEYIKTYEKNWDLYGLDELQVKLEVYQNTVDTCKSKHYDVPYSTYQSMVEADSEKYSSHSEEYHNKMYERYQDANYQLNGNYSDSCQYAYNVRKKEVEAAEKVLNDYDKEREKVVKCVEKETWNHRLSTSTASVNEEGTLEVSEQDLNVEGGILIADFSPFVDQDGVLSFDHEFYFTEQDLSDLSKLYIDGEYTNENIFLVSYDTAVTAIDEQLKLLDAGQNDLYIASHPQYTYTTSLDNFLAKIEYKDYIESLDLGDFVWLGVRDNEVVKLRLISMTYNPMVMDNQLEVEFSNMVKSRASRDDFIQILGLSSNRGKSSASGSGAGYAASGDLELTAGLIQKLIQNGAFKNNVNDIVGDAIEGAIVGNDGIFEYLQAELISADSIIANSGEFKELTALVAQIDALLSGTISSEDFHAINITAENATMDDLLVLNVLAGELTAGTIDTNKLSLSSEDGSLQIIGNTMIFTDENGKSRIQIGKDAQGRFTFSLFDADGTGILIDSNGVQSEKAIADNIINANKIQNDSITTEKLCSSGIYNWTDGNGNKVFNVANMSFDNDEFDVHYTTMSEFVTQTIKDVSDLKLSIGSLELSGEQIFKETSEGIFPDYLTITATCRNGAAIEGWFIDDVPLTNTIEGITLSDDLCSITINKSFMLDKESATIRVESASTDDDNELYDEITIYHLKEIEGAQGEAAYTVILRNENISFVVDYDSNTCIEDVSHSCGIVLFKGTEERTDYVIEKVVSSGGIDAYVVGGDTIMIEVQKGHELLSPTGNIEIHINIDGISFVKNIIWNRVTTGKAGEDGASLTILGSYDSEEEFRKNHPTGEKGQAYLINGYLYVWDAEKNDWSNVGRIQGDPSLNVVLGNESQNIPCTNSGLVLDDIILTLNYDTYKGLERVAGSASVLTELPAGIILSGNIDSTNQESGKITFSVNKDSTLENKMSGDIDIKFVIDGKEIIKTFTWSKALAGENGQVTIYELTSSDMVLTKDLVYDSENNKYTETISPKEITFYAWAKDSSVDAIQEYVGDFIIRERTATKDYDDVDATGVWVQGVSNYTYTLSEDAIGVRCTLYKAGTIKQLDRVTVSILSNADSIGAITELVSTVSNVSSTVSQQEKKIEDKVSLTTIIKTIDENGNEKSQSIKDYIADQTIDLTGFTSRVGTLETKTEDMATLAQMQTLIDQTEKDILLEAKKTYISSDKHREQLNNKNSVYQDTPKVPYVKGDLWLRTITTTIPDYNEKGEQVSSSTKDEDVMYKCKISKGVTLTGKTFTTDVDETLEPPYAVGDIWEKAVTNGDKIEIEYYKCKIAKVEGQSFSDSDWEPELYDEDDWEVATDYKTDGEISAAINVEAGKIAQRVSNTEGQVSNMISTVEGIRGEVYDLSDPENPVSIIDQQSKKISMVIGTDGVVDEEGNIISENIVTAINADQDGVKIKGDRIELETLKASLTMGDDGLVTKTDIGDINTSIEQYDSIKLEVESARDGKTSLKVRLDGFSTKIETSDAAKTATNYLDFSTSGLVVGKLVDDDGNKLTEDVLGNNVLIDSDSVDIRNGTTVLASYAASQIDLGKNSTETIINLCGGSGRIRNVLNDIDNRNTLVMDSSNNVALLSKEVAYLRAKYENENATLTSIGSVNVRSTVPGYTDTERIGFVRLEASTEKVDDENALEYIDMYGGRIKIYSEYNDVVNETGHDATIAVSGYDGFVELKSGTSSIKISENKGTTITGNLNIPQGALSIMENDSYVSIAATPTELNYCSGVTSSIQTQINNLSDNYTSLNTRVNAIIRSADSIWSNCVSSRGVIDDSLTCSISMYVLNPFNMVYIRMYVRAIINPINSGSTTFCTLNSKYYPQSVAALSAFSTTGNYSAVINTSGQIKIYSEKAVDQGDIQLYISGLYPLSSSSSLYVE